MKNSILFAIVALLSSLFLNACAREDGRNLVRTMQQQGFIPQKFDTARFVLFGMLRLSPHSPAPQESVLHVYIEGDGYAWQSRTRPSSDPTPHNPVGLRLAHADRSAQPVLYLARPCQFVEGADARMCRVSYWTSARLAPEVLQSLSQAIDQGKIRAGAQSVALMGYSGGGGAAALLAAQRSDVVFLGTVAGNLDHKAWTHLHGVSPLHKSLDPIDVAPELRHLPQIHLSSTDDSVIPPSISQGFCKAAHSPSSCKIINNIGHNGDWDAVWGDILEEWGKGKPF